MGMVPKAGGYKRVSACIFWDYHILLKEQNRSLSRSHCLRESKERWCPPSALKDRYLFIKSVKMDSGWFLSKDWLLNIFCMCVLVLMEKTWSYNILCIFFFLIFFRTKYNLNILNTSQVQFLNSQIEWVSFPICQGYCELDTSQVWIAQPDFSIFKLNGFLSQYIKVTAS